MTTPDRTEELIVGMLQRRAGTPPPKSLVDRVMHGVTMTVQASPSTWWARGDRIRTLGLVGVLAGVVVVAVLFGGQLGASGEPSASDAAIAATSALGTSPTPVPTDTAGEPTLEPSSSPTEPPGNRPAATALLPDTLASVTDAGRRLRVRTAPGTGEDSKRLTPVLPSGSHLLIVSEPERADGYEWYEVVTDGNGHELFGWVAGGHDGVDWIRPRGISCPTVLNGDTITQLTRIGILVCFAGREIVMEVAVEAVRSGRAVDGCPWTQDEDPCRLVPDWRANRLDLMVPGEDETGFISVVVPPSLDPAVSPLEVGAELTIRVALDSSDATECRIVDEAGRDVVSRSLATTECRLQPVLVAVDEVPFDSSAP